MNYIENMSKNDNVIKTTLVEAARIMRRQRVQFHKRPASAVTPCDTLAVAARESRKDSTSWAAAAAGFAWGDKRSQIRWVEQERERTPRMAEGRKALELEEQQQQKQLEESQQ